MRRESRHYYGSYGLVRGYGQLCRTLREADDSVYDDSRMQRRNGGSTDRNVVLVSSESGLCWWWDEGELREEDLIPVRSANGEQVRYPLDVILTSEELWLTPTELAGFG